MQVYRIGRTKFVGDITGEGARLHGGRWNRKLVPCIYSSESRALALLEYTANVNIEDIPRALSMTTFEIPDDQIFQLHASELPGDWMVSPAPSSTRDLGSSLLVTAKCMAIKLPSAIIPDEFNYLINPVHINKSYIRIVEAKDFIYDVRLKLK